MGMEKNGHEDFVIETNVLQTMMWEHLEQKSMFRDRKKNTHNGVFFSFLFSISSYTHIHTMYLIKSVKYT